MKYNPYPITGMFIDEITYLIPASNRSVGVAGRKRRNFPLSRLYPTRRESKTAPFSYSLLHFIPFYDIIPPFPL